MSLISENYQNKKLSKYGINIKTKYIVGNKILERNTDNSVNDDISNGIRCEKMYFLDGKLIHIEKVFDSRIEYTFVLQDVENKNYECPNCGIISKIDSFIDGCPYCGTCYNIDYIDKDLGSKYHYDMVLKDNKYKIITLIIDLIISLILSFVYIKVTSRTFNNYDIYKIIIYGIILTLILYYVFYLLDAYIILEPIKKYKNKENLKQIEFWKKVAIDKKKFFNNFNYELRKYYYDNDDIIDYDILDYISFKDYKIKDELYIEVVAEVREIYLKNTKVKSNIIRRNYIFKRNDDVFELNGNVNILKCLNCGSSIDIAKGECEYCHTKINYFQEWILEDVK